MFGNYYENKWIDRMMGSIIIGEDNEEESEETEDEDEFTNITQNESDRFYLSAFDPFSLSELYCDNDGSLRGEKKGKKKDDGGKKIGRFELVQPSPSPVMSPPDKKQPNNTTIITKKNKGKHFNNCERCKLKLVSKDKSHCNLCLEILAFNTFRSLRFQPSVNSNKEII